MSYVVILNTGNGSHYAYGPIADVEHARRFAEFMTREVDPAQAVKLIDPLDELLAFDQRRQSTTEPRAPFWPPTAGEIWEDRDGNRWACSRAPAGNGYLTRLSRPADDSAEEIWRRHGPLTRVAYVAPTKDEEPPF